MPTTPSKEETNSTPFLSLFVESTVKNSFNREFELNVSVVTLQWWLLNVIGSFDIQSISSAENPENMRLLVDTPAEGELDSILSMRGLMSVNR